jgi:flagellar hook-basal body complex protein FliE
MVNGINSLSKIALQNGVQGITSGESATDFSAILKNTLNEVNDMQIKSDQAMSDIATGRVKDLHSAAITIDKAEISMKMMLEVRNKAINAYKEILKTPM